MGALRRWFARIFPRRAGTRPEGETGCLRCGTCCESFGGHLQASKADLARWKQAGRADLLARVSAIRWIWIDPATGLLEKRCPFLLRLGPDTATCSIHEVKPEICRDYPTLAHGRRCLRGVFLGACVAWIPELGAIADLADLAALVAA